MRRLAFAALLALATPAAAQMRNVGPGVADRVNTVTRGGGDEIIFGGELQATLEADFNGARPDQRSNGNLFSQSLLGTYLLLPWGFAVNGVLRFEQTDAMPDGRGSVFRDQALWADELYVTWSRGTLDLFGGKIHPRFGSAWDRGPGLYGTDAGKEYELSQKIGAGARLWLSDLLGLSRTIGVHNIQAEVFEADRSALSTSIISPQWRQTTVDEDGNFATRWRFRNRKSFGTPDNTDFAGGWVLSAAGFGIPMPRGFAGYTVSWSSLRPGADAVNAGRAAYQQGGTIGAFWTIPLPQRLTFAPFVEYARNTQDGGFQGQRAAWWTGGFDLRRAPWTLSFAWQQRNQSDMPAATSAQLIEPTASLTYDLYFLAPTPLLRSASVTLGWRQLREGGATSNGVGGLLAWTYKF